MRFIEGNFMKLKIDKINNKGDFDKEYVTLKVLEDCDVGNYLLADSTYNDSDTVSNKLRHTFWIPDKEVLKGDIIKIFTGSGKKSSISNNDKSTTHIFYWGLKTAVWNDDGDAAILLEIASWKHKKVEA